MKRNITVEHLRQLIEDWVVEYPFENKITGWWRKPLLVTAKADERFKVLPQIAWEAHWMPWELLPSAKTVIVFFVPFKKELIDENTPGKFPCRNWGLAYQSTNALITFLSERIRDTLADGDFASAVTPATHNFDKGKLMAKWSHKHLAYVSGLGRFGVNAQMITPVGCAGRLGSLVTEADLGDHPLAGPEELCLFKAGQECLQCVKRCPVEAVSEKGIHRPRCWDRLNFNLDRTEALAGLQESTHVCGKCAVGVPCTMMSS